MLLYFLRSGLNLATLLEIAVFLAALLLAISVHEFAHAWAAVKLGDPTPKLFGRLTLNPRAHLDPLGTLMILFSGFGWGKPVPYNPLNLENPKTDSALVSVAGPVANILTAVLLALPLRWGGPILRNDLSFELIFTGISLNVGLAVFNLIPIYPLDGFRFLGGLLPANFAAAWENLAPYGIYFLLFLVFLPGPTSLINLFVSPVSRSLLSLILGTPFSIF